MKQAIYALEAEKDLLDIAFYVGVKDNRPEVAERLTRSLLAKCDLYAENPGLGMARPDLGESVRVFPFKRWVVIYEPVDEAIRVLRIIDGSRDYPKMFRGS
jgi:toxin ParE1/3/4